MRPLGAAEMSPLTDTHQPKARPRARSGPLAPSFTIGAPPLERCIPNAKPAEEKLDTILEALRVQPESPQPDRKARRPPRLQRASSFEDPPRRDLTARVGASIRKQHISPPSARPRQSLASVVGEPSQLLATALEARAFMQQREAILQLARRQQLLIQELERLRRSKGAGSTVTGAPAPAPASTPALSSATCPTFCSRGLAMIESCITVVPAPAIAPTVS